MDYLDAIKLINNKYSFLKVPNAYKIKHTCFTLKNLNKVEMDKELMEYISNDPSHFSSLSIMWKWSFYNKNLYEYYNKEYEYYNGLLLKEYEALSFSIKKLKMQFFVLPKYLKWKKTPVTDSILIFEVSYSSPVDKKKHSKIKNYSYAEFNELYRLVNEERFDFIDDNFNENNDILEKELGEDKAVKLKFLK